MKILAIGDIHGNYFTLLKLIENAGGIDKYNKVIILGDMVDRGPYSLEVIKWCMNTDNFDTLHNKKICCILGNHEQLILSYFGWQSKVAPIKNDKLLKLAEAAKIEGNGCLTTIRQLEKLEKKERNDVLYWLSKLPLNYEVKNDKVKSNPYFIFTHTPYMKKNSKGDINFDYEKYNLDVLWNIKTPEYVENAISIHGHTGECYTFMKNNKTYSLGIDSMDENKLTAISFETKNFTDTSNVKVFEVEFDPKILYGKKNNGIFKEYKERDWTNAEW